MWYDIGGAVTLEIDRAADPRIVDFVRRQMRPYEPQSKSLPADVLLTPESGLNDPTQFLEIENPAGDRFTTAWDGERAYALRCGRRCAVPDALADPPIVFRYEKGFPISEIWGSLVRPALSLSALRREAVVVHASAVAIDGNAVLVAGWSESGKTEVALALAETGATFLSDKWSIVRADGMVVPFPSSVGVRRWVLPYLPTLRTRLPAAARVQLAGARVAEALAAPLRDRSSSGTVVRQVAEMATEAADLAARVSMPAGGIRRIYRATGDPCAPMPLSTVVLLTTIRGASRVFTAPIDAETVAWRLATAAAFERRMYFSVDQRIAYAARGHARSSMDDAIELEQSLLVRALASVRLLEARIEFPADPRHLAQAIRKVAVS